MRAYKGFNKNLECTLGKGTFKYEIGKTYEEPAAKCARTGFHCVEEPIEVLHWYKGNGSRYCIVDAEDIHEDGTDKIACTRMTIVREITLPELAVLECRWMLDNPERQYSSQISRDKGSCNESGGIVIVRGKNPQAAGVKGAFLFLVKENKAGRITCIYPVTVDGEEVKENTYYGLRGDKLCESKS